MHDLSTFMCNWNNKQACNFNINQCQRRLIIKPTKKLMYMHKETGVIQENSSCMHTRDRFIGVSETKIILSYIDMIHILSFWEDHLEHMSRDLFVQLKKYYTAIIPSINDIAPNTKPYTVSKTLELKPGEIATRTTKSITYLMDQLDRFEKMRAELAKKIIEDSSILARKNEKALKEQSEDATKAMTLKKYKIMRINTDSKTYTVGLENDLNIFILNQYRGSISPIFLLRLINTTYNAKLIDDKIENNKLTSGISLDYYNGNASFWEPLLERVSIDYSRKKTQDKETVDYSFSNALNVNISDSLLYMLDECWRSWSLDETRKKSEKERNVLIDLNSSTKGALMQGVNYETVSEYSIENQSGETLTVFVKSPHRAGPIKVLPREIVNFCTDISSTAESYSTRDKKPFLIRVQFDPKLSVPPIDNLNLCLVNNFNHGRIGTTYYFRCSNRNVNMKKMFTISTTNQLANGLDLPITVLFSPSPTESQKFALDNSSPILNVPWALLNCNVAIFVTGMESALKVKMSFAMLKQKLENARAIQISLGDKLYGAITLEYDPEKEINTLNILPPYVICNYLPLDLKGKFLDGTTFSLPSMKSTPILSQSMTTACNIELEIEGFEKVTLSFGYKTNENIHPLYLKDKEGTTVTIYMKVFVNKLARYMLVFYAKKAIKNHTKDNLLLFGADESDNVTILSGQNLGPEKVTLLNDEKHLKIFLNKMSDSAKIDIGKSYMQHDFSIVSKENKTRVDYVMMIESIDELPNTDLKTKVVHIRSKYVFINNTGSNMQIGQYGCPESVVTCANNAQYNFAWTDLDKQLTAFVAFDGVLPSEDFALNEIGSIVQQSVSLDGHTLGDIIRIERYIEKGVRYIKAMKESSIKPYYLIQNESQYVTVAYKEKDAEIEPQYLDCETKVVFGWIHPKKPHDIEIQFLWGKANENPIQLSENIYEFSMEIIKHEKIDLPLTAMKKKSLWIELQPYGNSKVLRIRDVSKDYSAVKFKLERQISCKINNLGISLVTTYLNKRVELIYLGMKNVVFESSETGTNKDVIFLIQSLQMDNQMAEDVPFPVTLCSTTKEESKEPFLNVVCRMNIDAEPKPNFYDFESIEIELVPMIVKLEEDQFTAILDFITNIVRLNSKNWQERKEDKEEITLSIGKLVMPRFMLGCWFKPTQEKKSGSLILKSLRTSFLNIKEMPVTIEQMTFLNMYGKLKTLLLILLADYNERLESQKFGLIAGVVLAPFRDVGEFGTGITSFLSETTSKPTGIVRGTGSLIRGAFTGTFGTASGVTSAVSQGVLAFSEDEEYIKEKQKEDEKKPSNIFEGIGLGMFSILKSVGSGIAGIVVKPIEGASKDGVSGFFKGAGKGLVGVIAKPISGGFDFVSKTSEGIKSTATMFDEAERIMNRLRNRRPFYTLLQLIKPYDEFHASMISNVRTINDRRYEFDSILDVWKEEPDKDESYCVVISEERVLCIQKKKVLWELPLKSVKSHEANGGKVVIMYSNGQNTEEKTIVLESKESAVDLCKKLDLLC